MDNFNKNILYDDLDSCIMCTCAHILYIHTHTFSHTHAYSNTQTHTLTHLPRTKRILKLKKSVDEMDFRVVPGETKVSDP